MVSRRRRRDARDARGRVSGGMSSFRSRSREASRARAPLSSLVENENEDEDGENYEDGADAGTTRATISASFLGRSHRTSPVSMFQ